MSVLCFDISSGGVSAALFSPKLELIKLIEDKWELAPGETGAPTLSMATVAERFKMVVQGLALTKAPDAICIGSFMHNCVLLDSGDGPLTPVFTWLDGRGGKGLAYLRNRLGDRFHEHTGCRFHPAFPVFKLATLYVEGSSQLKKMRRVVSVKAFLMHRLTGAWAEDHGMASASGLYNTQTGGWDPAVMGLVGLNAENLPPILDRTAIAGRVTLGGSREFGLPEGSPVAVGSGDGFLAHVGSDCENPSRLSASLGASAAVRQSLPAPLFDSSAGTFCYQADRTTYVLGCAGSNGGNVLDWGRSIFGEPEEVVGRGLPIFIPLLHGERSPEWNAELAGSWHGLKALHTPADLARSVIEGVVFNLGRYVEILQSTSGEKASGVVLSGNGFLQRFAPSTLAAVAGIPVWRPSDPGLASLRGAGVCALRAIGSPVPKLHLDPVAPLEDEKILERYNAYKRLRVRDHQ